MSSCTVTPITTSKACSGKCKGGTCGSSPRVWVVAACEGMISLFEKQPSGHIALLVHDENPVFASIEIFQNTLMKADENHTLDQLIIVGAKGDIAWMHTALPAPIAQHITAEIEYPLISGWFKQPPQLANALEHVFAA